MKILSQKQNVPLVSYQFFINKFVDAIRFEKARSSEIAYESLAVKDVIQMFLFKSEGELEKFITENNHSQSNPMAGEITWIIEGGRVCFKREKKELKQIPSYEMIDR